MFTCIRWANAVGDQCFFSSGLILGVLTVLLPLAVYPSWY